MPILDENVLRALLSKGEITALTVDTNIFYEMQFQLNSATLQALVRLNARAFPFLLANTVCKEVTSHIERSTSQAFILARKGIGQALHAFETKKPTRHQLLAQITGGRNPKQVAQEKFRQYLNDAGCEILDDEGLVDTGSLFEDYFAARAPFGAGKKKSEFPDALALNALERTATNRAIGILVVSKDRDWEKFCRRSKNLYLVKDLDRALGLVADAPPVLKKSVLDWLESEAAAGDEVRSRLAKLVEFMELDASAYPSSGECDLDIWAGELQDITWHPENDIDVIEYEPQEDAKALNLVVSVPIVLDVKIPIDISFSVWDGFDKESVPMGSRWVEVAEQIDTQAVITFNIDEPGTERAELTFLDVEINAMAHHVDLGEIDLFEPEDYYLEDQEQVGE